MAKYLKAILKYFGVALAVGLITLWSGHLAHAQPNPEVIVKVTILEVEALDDPDDFGGADLYPKVWIGNQFFTKDDISDTNHIFPTDWEFTSNPIPISEVNVPVHIEIWDSDLNPDEKMNIAPTGDHDISLNVGLVPCRIGGDLGPLNCRSPITSQGTAEDDKARIVFRIDVIEPESGPDLRVHCIHDPIWPQQPDEKVTIRIDSWDANHNPRLADFIELYLDGSTIPLYSQPGTSAAYEIYPTGDSFVYGCRVVDDGIQAWSGWRRVPIGESAVMTSTVIYDSDHGGPTEEVHRVTPILYTGSPGNRIDIIFYADQFTYTGYLDRAFLDDVRETIRDTWLGEDFFLAGNQGFFNFYIALEMGAARDDCETTVPMPHPWAQGSAVLHTKPLSLLRNCTRGRVFSSRVNDRVLLHESGHGVFGLADEYCCDGGYWQSDIYPNVYDSAEACEQDAVSIGRTAADCRSWQEDDPIGIDDIRWTSDPDLNHDDLMDGNQTPQLLDRRRMQWVLDGCRGSGC